MQTILPQISMRKAAMVAGYAIVLMTLAAVVATDVTIGPLIIDEDPTPTFKNISENLLVFRMGILSWIIVLICDIVAAWGFYFFFKPVNNGISLLTAWIRIVYTAMLGSSIMNYNYVLELIDSPTRLIAVDNVNIESQTWFFLNSFDSSWSLGLLVFGLHIFLLGYLSLKSAYVPKFISIFLMIGAFGYVTVHLSNLLIPQHPEVIQILGWVFIIPMLSEVALGLWLLIKGKNIQIDQT
ncbi:DUF4386 domain-containing protein [Flavobacteriaceae bacterium M23B6Z8]